jgi:hypothetical protein
MPINDMFPTKESLIRQALLGWYNHIQTGTLHLGAKDLNKTQYHMLKVLSSEQLELLKRIRDLAESLKDGDLDG